MGSGSKEKFHHRPTLKQSNKPFKSRHASKGTLKDISKGKVQRKPIKSIKGKMSTKANRRNTAKQIQSNKRQALMNANRLFQGHKAAPKIVVIIPLCSDVDSYNFAKSLCECIDQEYPEKDGNFYLKVDKFKQTLQIIPLKRDFMAIIDAAKVADYVITLLSAHVEVDEFGEKCLSAIQNQGIPSILNVVPNINELASKKHTEVKKSLTSFMKFWFPDQEKIMPLSSKQDAMLILRIITNQTPKIIKWRQHYSYMIIDDIQVQENESGNQNHVVQLSGFLRGAPLSANRLIHLPNFGDFQIHRILSANIPYETKKSKTTMDTEDEIRVLDIPDPEKQDSLVSENEVDPMEGEQTWPTEEELLQSEKQKVLKRVPKGTSAYQASWIVESEEEASEMEYLSEDEAMALDQEEQEEKEEEVIHEDSETIEMESRQDEEEQVELPDEDENQKQYTEHLERLKALKNDLEFPDEVDTPLNTPARIRFQKYRGLRSFRTSPWDPYENLPQDYSRIFQFEDFKRTKHRILTQLNEYNVKPGTYITLELKNVPKTFVEQSVSSAFTFLFSLHELEHQMSLVNFVMKRDSEYTEPIKSKDPLLLQYGFRRYYIRPIYSQNTQAGSKGLNNVHKFERFFHQSRTCVVTAFAPIQISSVPAIMFKVDQPDQDPHLVASGIFKDMDTTRIIAKRIILTGYPFKINRKSAVVRYMFFNPEDINWFKPIQLYTKYGRIGNIKESIGTHGYMKCIFDGPLKAQDTICMNLYKRVFPKWNTRLWATGMTTEVEEEKMNF